PSLPLRLYLDDHLVPQLAELGTDPMPAGRKRQADSPELPAVHAPADHSVTRPGGAQPDGGVARVNARHETENVAALWRADVECGPHGMTRRARRIAPAGYPDGQRPRCRGVGPLRKLR